MILSSWINLSSIFTSVEAFKKEKQYFIQKLSPSMVIWVLFYHWNHGYNAYSEYQNFCHWVFNPSSVSNWMINFQYFLHFFILSKNHVEKQIGFDKKGEFFAYKLKVVNFKIIFHLLKYNREWNGQEKLSITTHTKYDKRHILLFRRK